jgi:hypothetical protein
LESQHNPWIVASLVHRSGECPDTARIAAALLSIWADVARALQPVIGRQGMKALYDRSVTLSAKKHPWLASARATANSEMDLRKLQTAVTQQTMADAAEGSAALLQEFHHVLVSLIGSTLSAQLLAAVRDRTHIPPTRDT